jgi:hypothetical protein
MGWVFSRLLYTKLSPFDLLLRHAMDARHVRSRSLSWCQLLPVMVSGGRLRALLNHDLEAAGTNALSLVFVLLYFSPQPRCLAHSVVYLRSAIHDTNSLKLGRDTDNYRLQYRKWRESAVNQPGRGFLVRHSAYGFSP